MLCTKFLHITDFVDISNVENFFPHKNLSYVEFFNMTIWHVENFLHMTDFSPQAQQPGNSRQVSLWNKDDFGLSVVHHSLRAGSSPSKPGRPLGSSDTRSFSCRPGWRHRGGPWPSAPVAPDQCLQKVEKRTRGWCLPSSCLFLLCAAKKISIQTVINIASMQLTAVALMGFLLQQQ